jgi:hypothetical protein
MVTGAAPDDMSLRAGDAILSQLGDLPLSFRMIALHEWPLDMPGRVEWARRVASDTGAISVFWLDLYHAQQVFLYIADPSGGKILVRSVVEDGGTEGRLETIAVIVRGAMKAILAGGEIGVALPPAVAPEPPRSERLDASLAYAMQLYSPDRPLLHGARLGFSAAMIDWLRISLAYRLQLPLRVETDLVAVDVRPHPAELGLDARLGQRKWRLDMSVRLVMDFVTIDVTALDDRVAATPPERKWIASLSPGVEVGRTAGRVATFYLGVSLDIALRKHRYVIESAGGDLEILAPWRLRPMFQLGARFTLL